MTNMVLGLPLLSLGVEVLSRGIQRDVTGDKETWRSDFIGLEDMKGAMSQGVWVAPATVKSQETECPEVFKREQGPPANCV